MLKMTSEFTAAAMDYKRKVAGSFMLLEPKNMASKLAGKEYAVTRKIDGVMACVIYRDGDVAIVGSNGRELSQAPVASVMVDALGKAGVQSATVIAELYMPVESGRPRCYGVASGLANPAEIGKLRLAPFDMVELDGKEFKPRHYAETHDKLSSLFTDERVRPVELRIAKTIKEVEAIYGEWVEGEGAEGIVVHSESETIWKIKPRHTVDAVAVGYTVGEAGLRDLLMAVRNDSGQYQVFGVCGNGFSDDERRELVSKFEALAAPSRFVRTDSRGIAFRMVRPEVVIEMTAGEFRTEDMAGNPKLNAVLEYRAEGWKPVGMAPGVSTYGMMFVRFRDDKNGDPASVRIAQLHDLCLFDEKGDIAAELPKSTVLARKVFRKISGEKVMVQKFMLWKTNKEKNPRYPGYVVFHTDYSSGRKEPLKRDIRVSGDEKESREIFNRFVAANVKKGWIEV